MNASSGDESLLKYLQNDASLFQEEVNSLEFKGSFNHIIDYVRFF